MFTLKASFNIKPCFISRLVGRDFENCLGTEILEVHDTDKNGNRFTHKIQRKEFPDFFHYQVVGSYSIITGKNDSVCDQLKNC